MKKLLLASFLLLTAAFAVNAQEGGMLTSKQAEYLRFNGAAVHIRYVDDRIVSRRARAFYEAALTNPYSRAIRCNIEIISSRGVNRDYEVIDSKTHLGVYASPYSVQTVDGSIEIKHGRGGDGMGWVNNKGHSVAARNCIFVD